MSEPWFDESHYAWVAGALLGGLGGLWGALGGIFAPRGKAKPLVCGGGWVLLAASVVLLVTGVVAWMIGQPYGVWYGLGLAGLIGVIVIGANLPVMFMAYRGAERRRVEAQDLS
jgi:uncharacterized membrane protein